MAGSRPTRQRRAACCHVMPPGGFGNWDGSRRKLEPTISRSGSVPVASHCVSEKQELSCAFGARVTYLLRGQETSNQQRRPPRLALVGHRATAPALPQLRHPCRRLPNKSVSRGRAFRTGSCPCEKESTSCRLPLRGLSSPTHRRTRAPGRAAGHRGPHSVRNRCAAAKLKIRLRTSWHPLPSVHEVLKAERVSNAIGSIDISGTDSSRRHGSRCVWP